MSHHLAIGILAAALGAQDVAAAVARAPLQPPQAAPAAPAAPAPGGTRETTGDSTAAGEPVPLSPNWAKPVVPSDTVIRRAVRETLIVDDEREAAQAKAAAKAAAIPERYTMSSNPDMKLNKYERFEKGFIAAKKPGCLSQDGLKHQNTFIFGGLLALPFIPVAFLRGKCVP
ncbi:hypothetical protein KY495_16070 [Massilia sp. PAMC28688]|uniref:hypothetical protein n=1 Tax=Massilia sp. PAMC28688 TaxID=2861283 RepID=UPI001C628D81|nr:hypothetical protein [Massilia sp. PAMC28688]QYF92266.1 hypothetical protein KY495_16070 [Massilia sp. PAMC28688]